MKVLRELPACQPWLCRANLGRMTTIQQNNFTPQPPPARDPITLTVCVTTHPSTTSRQHYCTEPLPHIWRGAFIFAARFEVDNWQPLLTRLGKKAAWHRRREAHAKAVQT